MALEIERKYTVDIDLWKSIEQGLPAKRIAQAYLSTDKHKNVRVRIKGEQGFITIKSAIQGLVRKEFEYEIPLADAEELLALCGKARIEKVRYLFVYEGLTWEVDVFEGLNAGLVIAEVELDSEEQEIILPPWVKKEVSDDLRYLNANLIQLPFSEW